MLQPRCARCGDTKPLDENGECSWRVGCEHRQMVHQASMVRLLGEMNAHENLRNAGVPDEHHRYFMGD